MRVPVYAAAPSDRDRELERQVLERLRWLKFGALEVGVQTLLKSMGYRDVVITGNMHWRGRSRSGGFDIRGWLPTGTGRLLTLIQVKALPEGRTVQRRFVDELRATMLSYGAPYGMIVATGEFAHAAIDRAAQYPGRPIRLIKGRDLARLAVKNFVGVRVKPLSLDSLPEPVLDELFFERLEELGKR